MHEVGHTLGLRHNFRASTVYPLAKISDPVWSREHGIAGSVMDYNPINIAVNGEAQGAYFEPTIGPYDYWAIEYAYRTLPKETEADELAKIAARGANDPLLAFSSDEEAIAGLDPDASRFDLGSDPLVYLQKRLLISQELWQRLQTKQLKPGESYDVLRRTFDAGFRQFARSAALTAKYVGGVYYVRDFAGTSQLPLTPVPPAKQRAALNLIATGDLLGGQLPVQARIPAQHGHRLSRHRLAGSGTAQFNPDFSLRARVLGLQVGVLNTLLSDTVLARLQDSEIKVSQADQALTLPELFAALRGSIWSELKTAGSIPGPRRDLQREHLRRIATVLTRPSSTTPADAVALFREEAKTLSAQIKAATRERQPRRADARAPDRIGGHARRGAEGAAGATRCLSGRAQADGVRPAPGASTHELTLAPLDNHALANLCGPLDANLRQIEAALDVAIAHRGGTFTLSRLAGADEARRRGAAAASTRTRRSRCPSTTSSSD